MTHLCESIQNKINEEKINKSLSILEVLLELIMIRV